MNRAILLYSGGIDSTYLLYEMLMDDVGSGKRKMRNPVDEVLCLSFNYGQSHADRELGAAKRITDMLGVEHLFVTLDFPFLRQDLVGEIGGTESKYDFHKRCGCNCKDPWF